MNPFQVLELPPDASAEDIKAAYHRLAKQWHPDRFSGAEKAAAETRFRELAEAFSILKDLVKRAGWVQQAPKPAAPQGPEGREQAQERTAEDWAAMAKAALEEGKLDQARALIHYAIRMDGQKAPYHALLGTILEQEGLDLRAAVKAFETAVRLAPKDVESHVRLGVHFKTLGMEARSERHFQTARELAPNHPKLRQALQRAAKPVPGAAKAAGKGKAKEEAPPGLVDQMRGLWGRLTGKG